MKAKTIYLDYNATTPVDERVIEHMMPFFTMEFGNAASKSHCYGWNAEQAVSDARLQILNSIGAKSPDEIIFTSGATESNNLAIKGIIEATGGKHIITSPIEHPCVLKTCDSLKKYGVQCTVLPIDKSGVISVDAIRAAIRPDTALISIMAVNHEIGTIQPVDEIAEVAGHNGILFHCDAAQAVGKIPFDVHRQGIDLLSISGHKIYGPKGVGALYIRKSPRKTPLSPQMIGGGQEQDYRSGTLNVPGIVGLGWACHYAGEDMNANNDKVEGLRRYFLEYLDHAEIDFLIHGTMADRVTGNLNLAFGKVPSDKLINSLKGIAVSGGSACSSGKTNGSEILKAMGYSEKEASRAIRISISHRTTRQEIEIAAQEIIRKAQNLGCSSKMTRLPKMAINA
jgi:cysteine desulfurase